jgi:hypothetical protein
MKVEWRLALLRMLLVSTYSSQALAKLNMSKGRY